MAGTIMRAADLGITPSNTGAQNLAAWNAAMAMLDPVSRSAGARWVFDHGIYSFAGTLVVRRQMVIEGTSGVDSGTAVVFTFPSDTGGFLIKGYDDATGDGRHTVIRHNRLSGGAGTLGDGITIRMRCYIEHVFVERFGRDGIHVEAAVGGRTPGDGVIGASNANGWKLTSVISASNGRHGFFTHGSDANAGVGMNCTAVENAGWGIYEDSDLGNTWLACDTDNNRAGGFWGNNVNATPLFVGCYCEPPQAVDTSGMWFGGAVGSTSQFVGGGPAFYRSAVLGRQLDFQYQSNGSSGAVSVGGGRTPLTGARTTPHADGSEQFFDAYDGRTKAFGVHSPGHHDNPVMVFTTSKTTNWRTGAAMGSGEVVFPRGLYLRGYRLDSQDLYHDPRIDQIDLINSLGAGTALFHGDTFLNRVANRGEPVGYRVVAAGTLGQYTEGRVVTAAGGTDTVSLNQESSQLKVGQTVKIGTDPSNRIKEISGSVVRMDAPVSAGRGLRIEYVRPTFEALPALTGGGMDSTAAPGPATQNCAHGRVAIAAGTAAVVVYNDRMTANSVVLAQLQSIDATLTHLLRVVPGAGYFTITGNAPASTGVNVCWSLSE